MRDLLPTEARRQHQLTRAVLSAFEGFGYELVSVPPFEYASVLEHDMVEADTAQVLRFVEPETGEIVALRPDMTPQIARLVASRLASAPLPARLCYEGSVVRRRRERARRDRQLQQAGIELVGLGGPEGDLEVVSVAASAMRAAGLSAFTLDLGHARIAASLLAAAHADDRSAIVEALAMKDADEVKLRAERGGLKGRELAALVALPSLYGGPEVFTKAEAVIAGTLAEPWARELKELAEAIERRALVPRLIVDLGETWSFSYYTGAMFRVLAHGPGEPVGSGGRYDCLYDRFGTARPAAGLAIDLGNLAWAIERGGGGLPAPCRVLVLASQEQAGPLLDALRATGVACALAPDGDTEAYAAAWRYTHLLEVRQGEAELSRFATAARVVFSTGDAVALSGTLGAALSRLGT